MDGCTGSEDEYDFTHIPEDGIKKIAAQSYLNEFAEASRIHSLVALDRRESSPFEAVLI